nr:hypothetical protein [Tanacetum cinerariifolium]
MIPQVQFPHLYSPIYPPPHLSQLQISHSSVPPLEQYQSHMDIQISSVSPIAYNSPQSSTQRMTEFSQTDSGLAILVFNQGDDPIAYLNKAMAFLTAVASLRFRLTNNQLRTSSTSRNQATIQDGKITMQKFQGRQGQSYAGTSYKGNATSSEGNNTGRQTRVVKCYNCQNEEQLAFLVDPGVPDGQSAQTTIPNNATFHTEDLDAYDSDCDDVFNAKAVLMANLSNYGSDVISEVPYFEPSHTDMDNQSVHVMHGFEQTPVVDFINTEITSVSNIIPYSQYLHETQQEKANQEKNNESLTAETLILEEVSRSKMLTKQNDLMSKEKKVNTTPINYVELNRLSEDFVKCFVPQQELFAEQAFWLQTSTLILTNLLRHQSKLRLLRNFL